MDLNFKFGRTDYRYPLGVPVLLSSIHTGIGMVSLKHFESHVHLLPKLSISWNRRHTTGSILVQRACTVIWHQ